MMNTWSERNIIRRVDSVERESFITLYTAARAWGTGWQQKDGVTAFWSAGDNDPSFSCVLDLARASRPEQTLPGLEDAVRARGATVIGVDTHPDLGSWDADEHLTALGYRRDSAERIWARPLESTVDRTPLPQGLHISRVDSSLREEFIRVLNLGWGLAEDAARGHVFAAGIGLAGWHQYLAFVDGEPAGVAVLFVHDRVAHCFLSATLPQFRGRGLQMACIQRRLSDGRELGCDLAATQTVVDNASPRNMARQGFRPLYRRWIYAKRLGASSYGSEVCDATSKSLRETPSCEASPAATVNDGSA